MSALAEREEDVLACANRGMSHVDAAARLGVTLPTLNSHLIRHPALRAQYRELRAAHNAGNRSDVAEWQARRDKAEREVNTNTEKVDRWRELLAPVELPPLPRQPVTQTGAECAVVFSDTHPAMTDWRTMEIVYAVVRELRPKVVIGNGDIADLRSLSRFLRDRRIGNDWTLRDEQRCTKSIWRTLAEIGQSWGVRLVETEANHSGNGTESRLHRYLMSQVPEFFELDGAEEALDYRRFFHPSDVSVELLDSVTLANSLLVMHGSVARKHGGASARVHGIDELSCDVLMGHTHRQGMTPQRYGPVQGVRDDERVIRVWEGGHCTRVQSYAPRANWVPGFAIVHMDEANHAYNIELVCTTGGSAVVNSLGRRVAA